MADHSPEFSPTVFHPFYFIRSGLRKSIGLYAHAMSGRMMDFGCGSKPYRELFNVREYVGVDYYNEGHPHDQEQIDVFYDGKTIPLPDHHFDSVLSSEVFEHIFNLDEILKEINRVMNANGHLLITCPFVWNEHEVPNDYARYSRFALEDILRKHGFEIVDWNKSGNFITTVFQLWILYWYVLYHKKKNRFFVTRWLLKILIVLPSNLLGKLLSKILPYNDSLYLNNIFLAKKIGQGMHE
jgi:SAM-dependent methyltransferase